MPYRSDIDGLRAIAVLSIVLYHMGISSLPGGFVGVDVFFVISGYLITDLISREAGRGQVSLRTFYLRRLRRLGPALTATIAVSVLAGLFLLPPDDLENLAVSTVASVLSISNILFWTQSGYFDEAAITKPLLHTWSLGIEEQFYMVWPPLLIVLIRICSPRNRLIVTAGIGLASLVAAEVMLTKDSSGAFFLMPFRICEFSLGALLGLRLQTVAPSTRLSNTMAAAGLTAIAVSLISFTEDMRFPGMSAMLPAAGAMLLIASGPTGPVARLLSLPPLTFIGVTSYSLYLVHWPILVFYTFRYGRPDTMVETLSLTITAIAVGALSTRFVEAPFRKRRKGDFVITNSGLFGTLGIPLLVTFMLCVWIDVGKGLPNRLPTDLADLIVNIREDRRGRSSRMDIEDCHFKPKHEAAYFANRNDCMPDGPKAALVVLGDSHAADLWIGLTELYPDHNILRLTGAGCSLGRAQDHQNGCSRWYWEASDWIIRNRGEIDAVFYSQRAAHAMIGKPENGEVPLPDPDAERRILDQLVALREEGLRVIFIGPRPEIHPRLDTLASNSRTLAELRSAIIGIDIRPYQALDARLARAFDDTEIPYVPTSAVHCPDICDVFLDGNRAAVVDYGHLSASGAKRLMARVISLSPILQEVLTPRPVQQ